MSANYQLAVGSCDERIAKIQVRLDKWNLYSQALGIAKMACKNNEQREIFDLKLPDKTIQDYDKNNVTLIKVERLIYTSFKNNANRAIYPRLLAKYDELMGVSYDMSGNLVLMNVYKETDYLDFCRDSLKQREYIKKICDAGVAGVKFFN
jgi:hypothetical protein